MLLTEFRSVNVPVDPNTGRADWSEAPLRDLVEHLLERDHLWLRIQLPEIEAMLADVIASDGGRHSAVLTPLRRVFQNFRQDAESHMRKEETVLFPAILKLETTRQAGGTPPRWPFGSLSNPVRMMCQDHDKCTWSLEEMRQITGNYIAPADAPDTLRKVYRRLAELEADIREHVRLEHTVLFPRAVQLEKEV
jgi:regulator of cell morphogenesis and NO signaling